MFRRDGKLVEKSIWKISSAVDGLFCAARSASAQRSSVTRGKCVLPPLSTAPATSPRLLHSHHGVTSSHGSGWGRSAYATFCASLKSCNESVNLARSSLWCALSERRASADRVRRGSRNRWLAKGEPGLSGGRRDERGCEVYARSR